MENKGIGIPKFPGNRCGFEKNLIESGPIPISEQQQENSPLLIPKF
jgi:hypothetical protein